MTHNERLLVDILAVHDRAPNAPLLIRRIRLIVADLKAEREAERALEN